MYLKRKGHRDREREREMREGNGKRNQPTEPTQKTCHVPFIVKLKYVRTIWSAHYACRLISRFAPKRGRDIQTDKQREELHSIEQLNIYEEEKN